MKPEWGQCCIFTPVGRFGGDDLRLAHALTQHQNQTWWLIPNGAEKLVGHSQVRSTMAGDLLQRSDGRRWMIHDYQYVEVE